MTNAPAKSYANTSKNSPPECRCSRQPSTIGASFTKPLTSFTRKRWPVTEIAVSVLATLYVVVLVGAINYRTKK